MGGIRFIPSSVHGFLDYMVAVVLLAAPNVLGFAGEGSVAEWLPRAMGAMVFVQSLLTDYELGAVKAIPLPVHLALDALVGLALVAGPFVFGFFDGPAHTWLPHLAVGLGELGIVLLSDAVPYRDRHRLV